jgi:hypothetical protein
MTEDGWIFKTYRVEWLVQNICVDQYGSKVSVESSVPFPTQDAALTYRNKAAHQHKYIKERWIPNDPAHDYLECIIQYKEVLVP